jgi:hypothetical protein
MKLKNTKYLLKMQKVYVFEMWKEIFPKTGVKETPAKMY